MEGKEQLKGVYTKGNSCIFHYMHTAFRSGLFGVTSVHYN